MWLPLGMMATKLLQLANGWHTMRNTGPEPALSVYAMRDEIVDVFSPAPAAKLAWENPGGMPSCTQCEEVAEQMLPP